MIAKNNAGLKVRGDMDNNTDSGTQYPALIGAGVDVKLNNGPGLLHHKYMIVDAENPTWDGIVLTGSHNWSSSAETANNENTLIVHDVDLANQYLQEFTARYYQFGGTDSIGVADAGPDLAPGVLALAPSYPNPFSRSTQLTYALPTAGKVSLKLYDVQGRTVRTLVNEMRPAGRHSVTLNGAGLSPGVYLARLEVGGKTVQRKVLHLK